MELSDQSPFWSFLMSNPSLPGTVIEARGSDPLIAVDLAERHLLPPKFLTILAENPGSGFRDAAAANAATPVEILERLAQDKDDMVRMSARQNLKRNFGKTEY